MNVFSTNNWNILYFKKKKNVDLLYINKRVWERNLC